MTTALRESPSHQRYLDAGCVVTHTEVGQRPTSSWSAPSATVIHFYGPCAICGDDMHDVDFRGYEEVTHSPYTGTYYGAADPTICVSCAGRRYRQEADLSGRTARCSCGKERPSDWNLPFFEFVGPGSEQARTTCGICRYNVVAHDPTQPHMARVGPSGKTRYEEFMQEHGEHEFTPIGGTEPDRYYCGHSGWD